MLVIPFILFISLYTVYYLLTHLNINRHNNRNVCSEFISHNKTNYIEQFADLLTLIIFLCSCLSWLYRCLVERDLHRESRRKTNDRL